MKRIEKSINFTKQILTASQSTKPLIKKYSNNNICLIQISYIVIDVKKTNFNCNDSETKCYVYFFIEIINKTFDDKFCSK